MGKNKILNDKWNNNEPHNSVTISKKKVFEDHPFLTLDAPTSEEDQESFLGFLHIDDKTGEIYVKDIDGEKIVLNSIDDIKKIATKKLLKK